MGDDKKTSIETLVKDFNDRFGLMAAKLPRAGSYGEKLVVIKELCTLPLDNVSEENVIRVMDGGFMDSAGSSNLRDAVVNFAVLAIKAGAICSDVATAVVGKHVRTGSEFQEECIVKFKSAQSEYDSEVLPAEIEELKRLAEEIQNRNEV